MPFNKGSVKGKARIMRKRLQLASMLTAATAIATFLPLSSLCFASPVVWAAAEGDRVPEAITTTDENGRKVYVNEPAPVQEHAPRVRRSQASQIQSSQGQRPSLVYWSSKESRWKPVPSAGTASMQAARSAAAEVSQYFGHESAQSANSRSMAANARGHQA